MGTEEPTETDLLTTQQLKIGGKNCLGYHLPSTFLLDHDETETGKRVVAKVLGQISEKWRVSLAHQEKLIHCLFPWGRMADMELIFNSAQETNGGVSLREILNSSAARGNKINLLIPREEFLTLEANDPEPPPTIRQALNALENEGNWIFYEGVQCDEDRCGAKAVVDLAALQLDERFGHNRTLRQRYQRADHPLGVVLDPKVKLRHCVIQVFSD